MFKGIQGCYLENTWDKRVVVGGFQQMAARP